MRRLWPALYIVSCLVAGAVPRAQGTNGDALPDTLRLDVGAAVRLAMRGGVEAAIARQDVAAARANVGVARSYALPQVDVVGTYTRNVKKPVIFFEFEPGDVQSFEIGQDNAWLGVVSAHQTIFASGRVAAGLRMARDRARAAEWAGDDAAAMIARDVKAAYYTALLAAAQTDIAERSLAQAKRNHEQIVERVRRGITADFDRLRAEVNVENRKPVVTRARNDEVIAHEALKRLLGVPLDHPVVLTESLGYVPFDESLDEVLSSALESRPDLAAVRAEASAWDNQLRAQSALTRPLLTLDANVSWQGETSDGLWPGDRESASSAAVGLSFTWPIFDGLRNRNQTNVTRAQARSARLQEERVADLVRLDVRSHYSAVQSIAQEIDGARRAEELAREAYKIAQVRYETGASRLIELLDADLALNEASLNLSGTLYRYNVALANLEYSTGQGPRLGMENGERDR